MKAAVAMRSFKRSDTKEQVRAGRIFYAEPEYLAELGRNGLAREVAAQESPAPLLKPVGTRQSASPAGQVSLKRTARKSKRGEGRDAE